MHRLINLLIYFYICHQAAFYGVLSSKDIFHVSVKSNFYRDSLQLMRISDRIRRVDAGIIEASVIMATETNKDILIRLGFPPSNILEAQESDIIIAIRASDNKSIESGIVEANRLLESAENIPASDNATDKDVKIINDIDSALRTMPDVNLALISIPGEYVKKFSHKLTSLGIHQHIFSDHVSTDDELEIKVNASRNGVLILGPGAGTSIINGKGIGFSNAIAAGPVGIVAAAGTGLQEVTSLLDHCGIGVKHGLGVGGNDPKDKIGGIMMLECMKVLEQDKDLQVVAIVSKPPSPSVMDKIIDFAANNGTKKYVLAFIGGVASSVGSIGNKKDGLNETYAEKNTITGKKLDHSSHGSGAKSRIVHMNSLTSSVLAIANAIGSDQLKTALSRCYVPSEELLSILQEEWTKLQGFQKYVRALYTGGTFAYETQVIFRDMISDNSSIYSNSPIDKIKQLEDSFKSNSHSIIDLGEEEFTKGRPHPMIDPTIRKYRILDEANDQEVAVILLDFVLGFGSNSDPVGAMIDQIKEAKARASAGGRYLSIVAHVCGTKHDLQGYEQSVANLMNAGCVVLPTNALAAVASALIVSRGKVDLASIYDKYLDLPNNDEEA